MKGPVAKSCPACGERYDPDVLFCPRDGTPLYSSRSAPAPSEHDAYLELELAGQIRIKHLIGIGSMGRVYRAWQGGIERDVAVKILHRELSGNAELVKRFHREAKVASRLVHPNVVQVLMTGTIPFSNKPVVGGEMYLVMEHLDGISLLSALAAAGSPGEGQALPLPRALHVALQICDAVGEAHAESIVHRDLKPENVMLVRRGEDRDYVKVLDFGIARLDWGEKGMETQAGLIFGTAKYISPEGAEGQTVGPQGDVYAIATILYQMLAGRTPFEGDSPVALLVQHAHSPPTDVREIARASYVPAPIAQVIMQNLAKKPGERAATARHFGREIVAAARASGLFPEEIAAQGVLSQGALGAVKLASKVGTKQLELNVDLATKIGAPGSREGPVLGDYDFNRAPAPSRPRSAPPPLPSEPTSIDVAFPSSRTSSAPASRTQPEGSQRPSRTVAAAPIPDPELDFDDVGAQAEGPLSSNRTPEAPTPTIQGTEKSLSADRASLPPKKRIVVAAVCLAVVLSAAILGVRKLVTSSASAGDTLEATLDEARVSIHQHAWTTPPDHNVKQLLDEAKAKWPNDARVRELRHDAAEKVVSEAIDRKYADDVDGALRLAKLALDLDPGSTTAQHLAAELEAARTANAAPAPTASASAPARKAGRSAQSQAGKVGPPAVGAAATPPTSSPVAPPPPASTKPAAPASTGPWL